jgi:hypothetical protein
MTYQELRKIVETGSVVGADSGTWFAKVIKKFTKEEFSHVAMFIWQGDGLWIYEFVEGEGYQCMPASQWFKKREGQTLYVGKGPEKVQTCDPKIMIDAAQDFREEKSQHYGLLSLFTVLVAQIVKKDIPTYFKVCSTFVQYVWEMAGVDFEITADPGNIMRRAAEIEPLIEVTNIKIKE